jgi:hypothetical protein
MVNTICVIDMIIVMVGCCLVTKIAVSMIAMVVVVCFLLTPMLMGVVVLVVQDSTSIFVRVKAWWVKLHFRKLDRK